MKFLSKFLFASILFDAPEHYQFSFQDAASPLGEEIIWFHDRLLFYFILIATIILWMIILIILFLVIKIKTRVHIYEIKRIILRGLELLSNILLFKYKAWRKKEHVYKRNISNWHENPFFFASILILFAIINFKSIQIAYCNPYIYHKEIPLPNSFMLHPFYTGGHLFYKGIGEEMNFWSVIKDSSELRYINNMLPNNIYPLKCFIGLNGQRRIIKLIIYSSDPILNPTLNYINWTLYTTWQTYPFIGFEICENYRNVEGFMRALRILHSKVIASINEDIDRVI